MDFNDVLNHMNAEVERQCIVHNASNKKQSTIIIQHQGFFNSFSKKTSEKVRGQGSFRGSLNSHRGGKDANINTYPINIQFHYFLKTAHFIKYYRIPISED